MNLFVLKKKLDRLLLLAFLLFGVVLLGAGCSGTSALATVDPAIIQAIVAYFITSKALDLANKVDRHKIFFIFHRTEWLGARNATWLAEADFTSFKTRLNSEFTAVENYVAAKDEFLRGRSDHPVFPHLDIANVAQPRHTRRSRDRQRAVWYRRLRKERSLCIIWRAAALYGDKRADPPYSDIWEHASDRLSATLKTAEFDMLLDRRLRVVERMQFQVAATGSDQTRRGRLLENGQLGARVWVERNGATGPWKDNFRIRMFEYARIGSGRSLRDWEGLIGSGNIGPGKDWIYGQRQSRLEYNGPLYPGDPDPGWPSARLPVAQQPHWRQRPGRSYQLNLRPDGTTGSAVLDDMFKTHIDDETYRLKDDWWHRSWLFCDHVMAAINLEAVTFGLRRAKGNAGDFDDIVQNQPDYVCIDANLGVSAVDANTMQKDDNDPFFENAEAPAGELQIGDQLIFWNSQLYGLISTGDWRLENAFVMDVDSNSQGGIGLDQLVLQGHGTGLRRYPAYRNSIASKLNHAMDLARDEIRERFAADSSVTEISWVSTRLIKWAPFGGTWRVRFGRRRFENLGAWWILVPVSAIGGDVDFAVSQLRRAFRIDADFVPPTFGNGDVIPADAFVLFPLFEPMLRMSRAEQNTTYRLSGTWGKYFAEKRSNPGFSATTLRPTHADGILMPGIERRGEGQPIPVVRSRYYAVS